MDRLLDEEARAEQRHGGSKALAASMPSFKSQRALSKTQNDRWLAEMTRCVFQAGFVYRVINHKWDDFEDVFFGFPPDRILMLSPDQIDKISQNPRIVRNRQKVLTVQSNAQYIQSVSKDFGSFGRFVSDWPESDLIGLFKHMKRNGARLGGMTGQRLLRTMGKDTFIVTGDVVRCLRLANVDITMSPNTQREQKLIQAAFNRWHEDSGLPYSHLSRIAAMSVDD